MPATQAPAAAALERGLEDQLKRAATRAFRTAFLVAAGLALLALRARAGAGRPEPLMRRLGLPLIAVLLVAAVLGVQVAAGGGDYVPRRPANPVHTAPGSAHPAQLEPLAEQIVLLGLDSAACRLGISRERLVLALAETRSLDPRASAALKAGLGDAVDRLDREGRLPKVSQLLPQALDQANLPGIVKTIIEAIPTGVIDNLLPTAPLLRQTVNELDVDRLLHELDDPSQLDSALQSAILQAALRQILDRLHP